MAAAPGPGPGLHPGRVPRLGAGGMPGRPRPPRPPGPAAGAVPPGPGGRRSRGRRPRPPGSWLWSPNGMGLSPPSRWTRRRDHRRPGPPGRPEHRLRPRRAAQSRPGRPERRPPMIIKYAIALAVLLVLAALPRGRSCPPGTCPATGPGTCASGCTCGCTPARASPTSSACGCAGAGWPRCAARPGSARPSRCATGSPTRASTRCSWAALNTGTACGSRLLVSSDIRSC